MQTTRYSRRPFEVDAVQVTEENMSEVSRWCKGKIQTDSDGKHIRVRVTQNLNERQTKAYVGDWVLYGGHTFKVYPDRSFTKSFQPASPPEELRTVTADGEGVRVDG